MDVQREMVQARFDARVSVHLHILYMGRLDRNLKFVDALAVCAPILFLGGQYLPDPVREKVKVVGDIAAVVLLALVVLSLVREWRPRLKEHQELLVRNIELAEKLGRAQKRALPEGEKALLDAGVSQLQARDLTLLKTYTRNDRHYAYREALKEDGPDAKCPVCTHSPWKLCQDKDLACECCGN